MRRLSGFLWLAMLTATSAFAQPVEPRLDQPLQAGWTFVPSMAFSGGWDSNVFLVGIDEGQPSDYVTGLTPAGRLEYRGPRTELTSEYRGAFLLYRDVQELNSLDQRARALLQHRATRRITWTLGQTYITAPTTDVVELVGVPFRRIGNWTSVTQGGVQGRLTPRLTARGGYAFRVVKFDDEAAQSVSFPGGHEHDVSGALDHRISERVMVGGSYGFQRVLFSDDSPDVMIHHTAATAEFRAAENVTLSGAFGLDRLGSVAGQPSRTGLAWRAAILTRLRLVDLSGQYSRSIVPAFGFGGTFQNEELMGTVRGAFARDRAYWLVSAAWRDNEPLVPGPPSRQSIWFSGTAGYAVQPWLRVESFYTLARQDAQRPGGRVDRTRIGFQVVTSTPVRLGER